MTDTMMDKKILVVDDDTALRRLAETALTKAGGQVYTAANGEEALRLFYTHRPHLVILDVMMPQMDGWETLQHIRRLSDVPVIMLTARIAEDDVIRGLDLGADDYVTKPFSVKILVARAKAALRREVARCEEDESVVYSDDYLTVDLAERRVLVQGQPVKLTAKEFGLLEYLAQNAGRVLTTQQILEHVWGWEYKDDVDYVRVYVWHLRQKIEADPKNPQYVLTEHGVGYRFAK